VVAMAYMLTQAALAKIVNMAAEGTGSVLCACLAQLKMNTHFLFAAPHTATYVNSTPFPSGFIFSSSFSGY